MGNNKIIFGDTTLIDLTNDTVTPDKLVSGETAHDRSGEQITGTAVNLDGLTLSTNDIGNDDVVVTKENNGSWVKKTASKLWDYIKGKIGISNGGSANKFLNERGTFTVVNSGKVYDVEMSSDLDEMTLTEDDTDKTTLPLVATYVGTRADWNNLSAVEQAKYRHIIFTDETGSDDISGKSITYTSSDTTDANATSWTSVAKLTSGLSLTTLFTRMSQMFKNIRYLYNTASPVGTINAYGGTTAPDGWLLCQGQAVSRTDYSELFSVIGTNFGGGDGSTTFNVPDLRGEFLRGAGTNGHSGQGSGGTVGQHQNATEVPAATWNTSSVVVAESGGTGTSTVITNYDTRTAFSSNFKDVGSIQGTRNNYKFGVRPTNTSVNFIIKAKR